MKKMKQNEKNKIGLYLLSPLHCVYNFLLNSIIKLFIILYKNIDII